jgi:hypothetical protein
VLTLLAGAVGLVALPAPQQAAALASIIVLTLAHSFVTTRAAPTNVSQRAAAGDADRLEVIFDRFERWQTVRAALQALTPLGVAWALAAEGAS